MTTEAISIERARARRRRGGRPGTAAVYRWELRKLVAQKRTFIGIGAAIAVPLIFVIAMAADSSGGPEGVPFGEYVRETGLAVPLVCLFFGAIWLLPLVTALVAGDIVAAEDQGGTLKTILTRSVDRSQVFTGKLLAALTYTLTILATFVAIATVVGGLAFGFEPLTTLSGTTISVGRGLFLIVAGTLSYAMPLLGMAAIALLLSTVTRNSAAAVVGTLMVSILLQILGSIAALDFLEPYLLSEQFNAWQGLLREPIDWDPVIRATWVSAIYAVPAVAWAFIVFLRRDVTGG
ncbi:MAG TPA: ABC transporter permease [Solirubrobacteraceae bacterium]|nr:ABC transporter permease [Solirubrobacteraceae bacterium]